MDHLRDSNRITIFILCAVIFIASFMPWGRVTTNIDFPFGGIFEGYNTEITLNAWNSFFNIIGLSIPNWLLSILAIAIGLFLFIDFNPRIRKILALYGTAHSLMFSLIIFFEGTLGIGLILTLLAYVGILFYLRKIEVAKD